MDIRELFKKYMIVIVIVLPILVLVLLRSISINHFQPDASKWASPTLNQSNIVTMTTINDLQGEILLINLGGNKQVMSAQKCEVLNIEADSIVLKRNVKTIANHDGPVIISSEDLLISVRIWMIISQMGVKNLFILTESPNDEILKYKFRSDTMARPE